jgi:hypothetical protein
MTHHIGYIHGAKLQSFSPPSFCQSGAGLDEYTYYYHKGYRQVTGKPYSNSLQNHKPPAHKQMAA